MPSLEELSARTLAQEASEPAIEYRGRWVPWGEMRSLAERVTGLIEASGAHPRAPICFMPRTRPSAVAAELGLISSGRTIRMVYVYQKPVGILRDLDRLRPAALVADEEDFTDELVAGLRERRIAAVALRELEAHPVPGLSESRAAADLEAPARHIETLTSGTTGTPKQFPLSFDMLAEHMVGSGQSVSGTQPPPMFMYAPLGNISGIMGVHLSVMRGQRLVLVDRFTVPSWLDYVRRYQPQYANLPAAGVQMVLDAGVAPEELSCIKMLLVGAAAVDPVTHRLFEERYGITILLAYGATEFAGSVASMTPELYAKWGKAKFGSVGQACDGAQLRVVDPDTGEILPPGQVGVLEATLPRMGPRWIRTSDLAMIDEDGFMFHRGRADGAINRGGFKILPETIERALRLHDAVSAAAVVGIADRRLGQVPAAAVQLRPGLTAPTIEELEAHLRDQVFATHIPTEWRFVETLPLTPSAKIDRVAVRKLFDPVDPA